MGLNRVKEGSQMYQFIDATWNTVKGSCPHNCGYCYMKGIAERFNKPQSPPHFDESELKTNLGNGNFIFVGSSNDMFANSIQADWVFRTLDHCNEFDNRYLFQSKNPSGFYRLLVHPVRKKSVICTTIESNSFYPDFMGNTPTPFERSMVMESLSEYLTTYVTVEPIMEFHLDTFVRAIKRCHPEQVNIGADTGHNHLPEPPKGKVLELIAALEEFTTVKQKTNLSRLLK
jgi:DNA repair photolyase